MAENIINGTVQQNSGIFSFYILWSAVKNDSVNSSTVSATAYIASTDTNKTFTATECIVSITPEVSTPKTVNVTYSSGKCAVASMSGITVPHNTDGTKAVTISAMLQSTGSGSPGRCTASQTVSLETISRASSITSISPATSSSSPMTVNGTNTLTAYFSSKSSEFTHKKQFLFQTKSSAITALTQTEEKNKATSPFVVPTDWLYAIPSSLSARGRVDMHTYSGTAKIGASTKYFFLKVPSYTPSASLSVTAENTLNGMYVQGHSRVKVSIGASSQYGAGITTYNTNICSVGYQGSSFTSEPLTASGTVNITTTVTDTRGITATSTKAITVEPYSSPYLSVFTVTRCNSDGTPNNMGAYIKITVTGGYSTVKGANTASCSVSVNGGSATAVTAANGSISGTIIKSAAVTSMYTVTCTVTDKLSSITQSKTAPTVSVPMNIGANRISFGGISSSQGFSVLYDTIGLGCEGTSQGITVKNTLPLRCGEVSSSKISTNEITSSKSISGELTCTKLNGRLPPTMDLIFSGSATTPVTLTANPANYDFLLITVKLGNNVSLCTGILPVSIGESETHLVADEASYCGYKISGNTLVRGTTNSSSSTVKYVFGVRV